MKVFRKLNWPVLSVFFSVLSCIPAPRSEEIAVPLLVWYTATESDCLYAGYDRNQPGGGVLVCVPRTGGSCADLLYIRSEDDSSIYTDFFTDQGLIHDDCTLPASNASARFSSLNLPANWILYHTGGTSGPHIDGSYESQTVSSCAALGLDDTTYHGASRLAKGYENSVVLSKTGLLGLEDSGGSCTDLQLISDKEKSILADYHSGTIAIYAACSFGESGSSIPACPDSIDTSKFILPGI